MGLFDFLKTPEQKKRQEAVDKFHQEIFPGGNKQQQSEIQEVRELLKFRYTREQIQQAYIYALVLYYTSQYTQMNDIVDAVLRNEKTSVTRADAEKIYLYILNKKHYNSKNTVAETLKDTTDGEKLFMIVFGGIVEIKKAYKDLTNSGKFEVILFNSLIALQEYQSLRPEKYEETFEVFLGKILRQAVAYNINMSADDMTEFINSRFQIYSEEINRFFVENEGGYLLVRIYSLFYESPLDPKTESSFDLFEYAEFLPALIKMRNYVIENTNSIFY